MKVKTSELIGKALDWAVAKCEGGENFHYDGIANYWFTLNNQERVLSDGWSIKQNWHPSTNWSQSGLILEREWLDPTPWPNESREGMRWHCQQYDSSGDCAQYGPTLLIAAMRCYVASKLGDAVEIPDALRCTVGGSLHP